MTLGDHGAADPNLLHAATAVVGAAIEYRKVELQLPMIELQEAHDKAFEKLVLAHAALANATERYIAAGSSA